MGKFSRTYQLAAVAFALLPQVYCNWEVNFYDTDSCDPSSSAYVTYTGQYAGDCVQIGNPIGSDNDQTCTYTDNHPGGTKDPTCRWPFNNINSFEIFSGECGLWSDSACTAPLTDATFAIDKCYNWHNPGVDEVPNGFPAENVFITCYTPFN